MPPSGHASFSKLSNKRIRKRIDKALNSAKVDIFGCFEVV